MRDSYSYDVALSFAGEDRPYVQAVAETLRSLEARVFYDAFEEADLWGKDLYAHLSDIYEHRAYVTVMFISSHYKSKAWTNKERESAQARALYENREYILPVRFDDTVVPGLSHNIGYIDARNRTPQELAALILRKLPRDDLPKSQADAIPWAVHVTERTEKDIDHLTSARVAHVSLQHGFPFVHVLKTVSSHDLVGTKVFVLSTNEDYRREALLVLEANDIASLGVLTQDRMDEEIKAHMFGFWGDKDNIADDWNEIIMRIGAIANYVFANASNGAGYPLKIWARYEEKYIAVGPPNCADDCPPDLRAEFPVNKIKYIMSMFPIYRSLVIAEECERICAGRTTT